LSSHFPARIIADLRSAEFARRIAGGEVREFADLAENMNFSFEA
jgi:hypothetical protein